MSKYDPVTIDALKALIIPDNIEKSIDEIIDVIATDIMEDGGGRVVDVVLDEIADATRGLSTEEKAAVMMTHSFLMGVKYAFKLEATSLEETFKKFENEE